MLPALLMLCSNVMFEGIHRELYLQPFADPHLHE
jgi:hypothetical protein